MVDHTADFNLAYTEHARRNLLAEGLHPRRVLVTGSPMTEVLDEHRAAIEGSAALTEVEVETGQYFLVSAHREENVDSPARLRALLECLNWVPSAWGLPVVVSTHPRTRKRLEVLGESGIDDRVRCHAPFGLPAVTLRSSIERPEALDTGAITMTDLDPEVLVTAMRFAIARLQPAERPADYRITNTSEGRELHLVEGFPARVWSGLREGCVVLDFEGAIGLSNRDTAERFRLLRRSRKPLSGWCWG